MIVQCPQCNTKFKFPDERMKPEGVKVRCSKCKHVFRADAPPLEAPRVEVRQASPVSEQAPARVAEPTQPVEPKPSPPKPTSTHDELFAGFAAVAPETLDSHAGQAAGKGFDLDFGKDDNLGLDFGQGEATPTPDKGADFDFGADFDKDDDLGLDFGALQAATAPGTGADFDFGADFDKDDDLGLDFGAPQAAPASETGANFDFGADFDKDDDLGLDFGESQSAVSSNMVDDADFSADFGKNDDLGLNFEADRPSSSAGNDYDLGLDAEFGGKGEDDLGLGSFGEESDDTMDRLGFDDEFGADEQTRTDSRTKEKLGFDVEFGSDAELGFEDVGDASGDELGDDNLFGSSANGSFADLDSGRSDFGAKAGGADEDYLEDEFFKDFEAKHGSDSFPTSGYANSFSEDSAADAEMEGASAVDLHAHDASWDGGHQGKTQDPRVERDDDLFSSDEEVVVGSNPISLNLDEPMADKRKAPRGGKGKSLAVAFVLLLLVAGTAGAVWYLGLWQMLPSLPDLFKTAAEAPKVEAPAPAISSAEAVKHIVLENVRQYTVPNDKVGTVFVIEGRAVNDFKEPKELIKVEGILFDQSGKPLESKNFMAGNTLSLFQLQVMSKTEIEAQLASEVGILSNNTNLASGASTPFMVVFFNPPDTVKEFQIKIVEAKDPPK